MAVPKALTRAAHAAFAAIQLRKVDRSTHRSPHLRGARPALES
jgi:hypothetical protein